MKNIPGRAGWPSPAEEELTDLLSFDEWLLPRKEASVLVRVAGSAMTPAGILPGDVAIVERGRQPNHGDIVVADIRGTLLLRFYERREGTPTLVAADSRHPPVIPNEDVTLLGGVTAVIRKYH